MKMFQYSAIVLLLFVVVNDVASHMSAEESDKFMNDVYACKNETGATDMDMEDLYNRNLPTTKQAKCLNACVFKKLDLIKDGKYAPDGLVKVVEMDKTTLIGKDGKTLKDSMKDINGDCKDITDADQCELAAKLRTCLNAAAKKREFCPNVF